MENRKELRLVAAIVLALTLLTASNYFGSKRGYRSGQLDMCNKLFRSGTGGMIECVETKQGLSVSSPLAPGKTVPIDEFLGNVSR